MDKTDNSFTSQVIKEFYIKEMLHLQATFLKYKVLNILEMMEHLRITTQYEQNFATIEEIRNLIGRQPRFNFKNDII